MTVFETQVNILWSPKVSNSWHALRVSSGQGPEMTITHMLYVHSLRLLTILLCITMLKVFPLGQEKVGMPVQFQVCMLSCK
jgi:hypothetical protein